MPTAPKRKPQPKQHECTHPGCTWAFVFPSDLSRHMRTHTDEKPKPLPKTHKCTHPGCTLVCTSPSQLVKHEKTHTGVKDIMCTHTDEQCTEKNSSVHIRVVHWLVCIPVI